MPPIVVAAAIAAAGSVGGAVVASRGAKKAAEQQVESGDQALAHIKEANAPFMERGTAAFNLLSDLSGVPAGPAAPPAQDGATTPNDWARPRQPQDPIVGKAVPRQPERTLASLSPQTQAQAQTRSGFTGGRMMQAPDGSQQMVEPDQVEHYMRLGAKVVG